jgi:hypothetical protein
MNFHRALLYSKNMPVVIGAFIHQVQETPP